MAARRTWWATTTTIATGRYVRQGRNDSISNINLYLQLCGVCARVHLRTAVASKTGQERGPTPSNISSRFSVLEELSRSNTGNTKKMLFISFPSNAMELRSCELLLQRVSRRCSTAPWWPQVKGSPGSGRALAPKPLAVHSSDVEIEVESASH